jgi:site-specific DNA recombinase
MKQAKEQSSNGTAHTRYAAIYARVSTDDQVKGFSIPTQLEACQKLASEQGYTTSEAHVFVDDGVSGTTLDRPALRRLRDLIRAKSISAVIVLDPDRLARKIGKLLVLKDEMDEAGVQLCCVSHPVEQGPEGGLFFQLRGAVAEYEREKLLERMRRGKMGRAKAGHPNGGNMPLGYRYISMPHGGHLQIDEEEAAVVRRIFDMYLSGMNFRTIARQLTLERIPTHYDRHQRDGRKLCGPGIWNVASINLILHNETYAGTMYWNKRQGVEKTARPRNRNEWVAIQVPAIISRDTFAGTQKRIARNRALSRRNRKHEYLFLAGRLRCGRCGKSMTGYSPKNVRRYYRCYSQIWRPQAHDPFCSGVVRADDIEAQVWEKVEGILHDPKVIFAEVKRRRTATVDIETEAARERKVLQVALAKIEREFRQWEQAYAHEVISLDDFKVYKGDIDARREQIEAQQQELDTRIAQVAQAETDIHTLIAYCERVRANLTTFDIPTKRLALEALNIQVSWTPGERPRITGKIPVDKIETIAS